MTWSVTHLYNEDVGVTDQARLYVTTCSETDVLDTFRVLDTFKCVHDVVLRVNLTLDVRRVGKNSRPRLGRGDLEIDITADALK
jgi:hypothetical protein